MLWSLVHLTHSWFEATFVSFEDLRQSTEANGSFVGAARSFRLLPLFDVDANVVDDDDVISVVSIGSVATRAIATSELRMSGKDLDSKLKFSVLFQVF